MKVRCTRLLDAFGNAQESSAWLTIGKVYHVLSIILDGHGNWLLRLVGDTAPGGGFFPLHQFEVLTSKIPDTWIVTWNNNGVFELTTNEWNQLGYWERYFENDAEAIRVFEEEKRKIILADP